MFDPGKTVVLAFECGGVDEEGRRRRLKLLPTTISWLYETFPHENVFSINIQPYECARNAAIRNCALPVAAERGLDWLLSVDNDVTVTRPGIEAFLRTAGDVVACQCPLPSLHAWDGESAFHTPLWRCRIEVLRRIRPPWFRLVYDRAHCKLLQCDCQYFAQKCQAAGFTVRHGGHCGHGNYGSASWPATHHPPAKDPITGLVAHGAVTRQLLAEGRLA